jgi:hypothetical protein
LLLLLLPPLLFLPLLFLLLLLLQGCRSRALLPESHSAIPPTGAIVFKKLIDCAILPKCNHYAALEPQTPDAQQPPS